MRKSELVRRAGRVLLYEYKGYTYEAARRPASESQKPHQQNT